MAETNEQKGLTREDWQRAVDSQGASNLSGLLHSLAEVRDRVWVDVRAKRKSTFARHPIIRLYLHHMFHLAFDGQVPEWEWGKAYHEAQQRALGYEPEEEGGK